MGRPRKPMPRLRLNQLLILKRLPQRLMPRQLPPRLMPRQLPQRPTPRQLLQRLTPRQLLQRQLLQVPREAQREQLQIQPKSEVRIEIERVSLIEVVITKVKEFINSSLETKSSQV